MSEYANRKDRGRLVGHVFSMQALGLIVGPLVALVLLSSGISSNITWRLLLGLGAVPAAAVVYLRAKMPESPRFQARVKGKADRAAKELDFFADGAIDASGAVSDRTRGLSLRSFLGNRRMLMLVVGTAGTWFLFEYAYYGNTLSLPSILKEVAPHSSLESKLLWTLGIFVVFALPGYLVAIAKMDRIGHRRLQFIGFGVMALCFLVLGAFPTTTVVPFLAIFGLSYFFIEFGPNMTTFVMPSEVFPVSMRTTGHGLAAGIGKLGAFVGVLLVPQLQKHINLRGMLLVAGAAAILGFLLTMVLPEPAGRPRRGLWGGRRHRRRRNRGNSRPQNDVEPEDHPGRGSRGRRGLGGDTPRLTSWTNRQGPATRRTPTSTAARRRPIVGCCHGCPRDSARSLAGAKL